MNRGGERRFRPRRNYVLAPTVYESGEVRGEAVMSRLTEITSLPLSKPIEIEPIGFACRQ
jgi:hypothetical protein